ncbi:hypothetical protein QN277_003436 [Acacia crassicarpa]|uniref:Uncharacterized protein n=1 Tax=Acacia crassicarpa TaxID=499986 RepID=A0AAE1J0B6_9FABA|nr:hypothetical protein QN277_003436 [Acacia crassicarpa]
MYPIFNYPQFAPSNEVVVVTNTFVSSISMPNEMVLTPCHCRPLLKKLIFEERETLSCSSFTSDADESDVVGRVVASQTYWVWSPKSASVGRRSKKNTLTGSSSSKRWRLRDLILRSGSQGNGRKDVTVFVSKRSNKVAQEVSKMISGADGSTRRV